ncbi:MAG: PH domain-containing protein [Coriobacteriales bacterium]|nr:PH domain-containing protein [Coriobacteriales bacterium]
MSPQSQRPGPTLLPSGGIAPGPHRIHPAYVVINALQAIISIVVLGFVGIGSGLSYLFAESGPLASLGVILILGFFFVVVVVLSIIFAIVYYRRFLWEITETDIHIYSGIIFKKQVHIPFQRVQSIDFNAQIVERILGLVKLKIETAGGANNRGVIIPALKLGEAEALRAEVFARKQVSARQQEADLQKKAATMRAARSGFSGLGQADVPAASATQVAPRFDPQTGQPLPQATAVVSSQGEHARFDPQTGQPLPQSAKAASPSAADTFVQNIGDGAEGLRGIYADEFWEDAPTEYEYGLTAKELFLSAISGDHYLVIFLVLIGLISQAAGVLEFFGFNYLAEDVISRGFDTSTLPIFIFFIVGFFIFVLILGIINTAISYGSFKARRRGGRIEVERGLLARQYKGVSISRVQSVEIRQGFIRRLMGYAELKLLTIDSMDANSNQQNAQAMQGSGLIIHPFVKVDKIEGILAGIASEFDGRPTETEFKPLPKVALRRSIIRRSIIPGLIYAICVYGVVLLLTRIPSAPSFLMPTVPLALGGLALFLFILQLIGAILWYRHSVFAYNQDMLTLRQGGYSRMTIVIPRRKIQWAATHQNPFQRRAKVATISATTAAGYRGTISTLRDLSLKDADSFLEWVRPHPRQN